MSIIVSDSRGWLLDAQSFINENYSCCHDGCMLQPSATDISNEKYRFKKEYFDIFTPHIASKSKTENVETKTSDDGLTVLTGGVEVQKVRAAAMCIIMMCRQARFKNFKTYLKSINTPCTVRSAHEGRDVVVYVGPYLAHVHCIFYALRKEERNANETLIRVSLIRKSTMKR